MEVAWCSEHGLPHSALLAWSSEDRAKLIAHLVEEAQRCQMCGTSDWEWAADRHAYTPVQQVCTGCYLKEIAGEDAEMSPGRRVALLPTAQAERMGVLGASSLASEPVDVNAIKVPSAPSLGDFAEGAW